MISYIKLNFQFNIYKFISIKVVYIVFFFVIYNVFTNKTTTSKQFNLKYTFIGWHGAMPLLIFLRLATLCPEVMVYQQ